MSRPDRPRTALERVPIVGALQRDRLDRAEELRRQRAEVHELRRELRATRKDLAKRIDARHDAQRAMLQLIADDEPRARATLRALRSEPSYEAAFDDPDPLVSIVIPTYTNVEGLRTRAVPSALAQTHANVEVVVIGDAAPPQTAEAIAAIGDDRVVYRNRERRGPYPDDPRRRRFIQGSAPFNEGVAIARGRWITPFADDDALHPHHVATLLAAAREQHAEFCYGRIRRILPDDSAEERGQWPPELLRVSLQAAIYHRGLGALVEQELGDELFETSADKSMLRRMLRAGVRFGFADEVVVDYHYDPSKITWRPPRDDR